MALALSLFPRARIMVSRTVVSKTSTASPSKMSEEEDLAVLIYKTSKTAKARAAAAAAAKEKGQMNASSVGRRTSSTRKRSCASQGDIALTSRPGKKRAVNREQKPSSKNQKVRGKYDWRKYAKTCSTEGCTNQVVKGGVCKRHGAKVNQCSSEGCTNQVKKGGVCKRHGAKVNQCSSEGCTNVVVKGGVCVRHGAKVKLCSREGCTNQAQKGGVCIRHGAKKKQCSSEGCTNQVKKGGVCVRHGAKKKQCSNEGCTNQAKKGGVCIRHGAKVKLCSSEGCTNQVVRGGVCWKHGANRTPNDVSTAFGSDFEKTTTSFNLPNYRKSDATHNRSTGVPAEVVIPQEIVEV